MLARTPAFTLAAIATLALGIGANSAIFSVANGVLLRPLPYPDPSRLAMVWMDNTRMGLHEDWHSFPDWLDYRGQNSTFDDIAIFNTTSRTLTGEGDPDRIFGAHSSANLFDVLGVRAAHGRVFTQEEDAPSASLVVVLSDGLWRSRFGGRDDAVGRTIQLNGQPARIIGVMPAGFAFPSRDVEFWIPTRASDDMRQRRYSLWLQCIGRIKTGVSLGQAQADLARINAGIVSRFPDKKGEGVLVASYRDHIVGSVRTAIWVLVGAVGFVLLIACTNVANLLLSRTTARERELAVRVAIGAARGRIVRQLLTESLLLGALGGAVGLGLAWFGLRGILAAAPADVPRLDAIVLDGRAMAFTAGLSLLTSLVFGLMPALQLARGSAAESLKDGARTTSSFGRTLRRGLVALEMALAVVLLVGAGLMLRSFDRLLSVDLGFRTDHVLSAGISLFGQTYREAPARVEFFRQVLARAEAEPGVLGAAGIDTVFLSATPNSTFFSIDGRPDFAPEDRVELPVDVVTPNYFKVMGVAVQRGRAFDARDTADSMPVVIVNEAMARQFWPGGDALGHRIKYGSLASNGPWMTIVGVVADTRRTGYESAVRPESFLPFAQSPASSLMLVVRTSGRPEQLLPSLRAIVREVDPSIALQRAQPLDSFLVEMTAQRRLNTLLLTVFGIVAALLAAVGIYGVIAYSVEQRAKEISVRVALGATAGRILRIVLTEGLAMSAAGIVVGLAAALALSRSISSLLYNVPPNDLATFATIAGVAVLVALAASAIPALRAARTDPVQALKRS